MIDMRGIIEQMAFQQGRQNLSPEEEALLQQQQEQSDPMERIMVAQGANPTDVLVPKESPSILQRIFGRTPPGERKADELVAPGSFGDKLRERRKLQEQMMKEQAGLQPEDMLLAANDTGTMTDVGGDRFGGVSMRTRAAMHELGKSNPEFQDMVVGGNRAAPEGHAARVGVRGAQSATQEEQLVRMLKGRGMSEGDARARAKAMGRGQ